MSVHLVGNYRSERCLTEAGRTIQKNMVEGLAALTRGLNRDLEVLFNALLSDVFRKDARAKRQFECRLFLRHQSRYDPVRHTSKGKLATKGTKPHVPFVANFLCHAFVRICNERLKSTSNGAAPAPLLARASAASAIARL